MNTDPAPHDMPRWHPVARSADLRPGANIVAGFAEGQELALWRSADGAAQAWDNRCPHRSVRFTLGQVIEDRLACAYHGWQYAAGNGQCVSIPAHPAMQAPRNVCAKVFGAVDAAGMLWVNLVAEDASAAPPSLADAVPTGWHFCRTLTLRADAQEVRDALAQRGFTADAAAGAFRGALEEVRTIALVLDAQPQLTFVHLWTEASRGSDAMKTLHAAARNLRSAIETQG
ncbi:nitrite reductase/ring-hydroxylating ferredoxin subunit [Variovorax boronicumulans]|uniref:Rieske 2Fe-2S domain-containing protein n=1 Tax=Variovorax boronicumulans TaxID=436515 RepID=UPI002786445F|nr:Rieske 2Fe-2S domain-containing protein [Variovorax boronicumulans]MDP9996417.1 nitrite reductase/ring-hydroxylating ferredoxin subunit [Variovorax boronicumulans]MDQ0007633.1 nitrite reductase/ring-hydroxylating ferredoxin subunit [Variovorax boronicumulans]MDQ0040029.1 nitrite reductase/ring-hydroxylating ferredoxin subunit [Variovorax boronicumulans]